MAESYPNIEAPPLSEAPEISAPPAPSSLANAILISYLDQKAAVDISAALTVEDVKATLLSVFNISPSARVIVKRSSDGAVVVPGPKLAPGEYVLEEIDTKWQIAYKNVRDKHYPNARQQVTEKHIPFIISTSKTGAEKVKSALLVAHKKAGEGLTVVGGHVNRGLTTAGTHVGGALNTAGTHIRGQVQRATNIANTHAVTNSHTWTAKFWSGLVRCAPGPISWITGVPVDQLVPQVPAPEESSLIESSHSETVPLSKPAEVNAAA